MPQAAARRPRTVALYLTANFLYWIALYLYVPTLSTYVGQRTPDLALVGLVLSMYGFCQAFVRFPVGIAVDATGRGKPFIAVGFVVAAAGALTMGHSTSVFGLAVGRGLTGVAAATWVPLLAIFSGMFPPERAVLAASLLNLSGSVGRTIATSLNGFVNEAGGYGLAFTLAAAAAGAAVLVVLAVPLERRPPRRPSVASLLALARRREVVLPTLLQTLLVLGEWAVSMSFLPLLAASLGAGDVVKSLLVGLSMVAGTVSNLANTWLERRIRHTALTALAFGMLIAGITAGALAPSVGVLFVSSSLIGLGVGLGYPTLVGLMFRRIDQAERNTAAGLHQSVYAIGMFAGPALGGVLAAAFGLRVMFGLVAAFVLAASAALLAVYARTAGSTSAPARAAAGAPARTPAGKRGAAGPRPPAPPSPSSL